MVAAKLFDPRAGSQRVDRYELIGEIASGGMATVYLARLTGVGGFQRFVAMKRLHPHLASEREFVEMFLDEARLAAGIHHPNVVSILEVGASSVGYYLVMEYIEGDTLARLLARAASGGACVPPAITIRVALDMLAGLNAAHELRDAAGFPVHLVHRDVSPQNVLVGSDGIARITDFGVARAASRLSATRAGQLKGKLAYMAPEQAQGDETLDRRADVFSSGIVIWEALASSRLFKADHEAATLSRVMTDPIPDLGRLAPHLEREVCDVVMRALERDPRKRYATCAEFADSLEGAAQVRPRVASLRELSSYVHQQMGEEMARQRDAVREWIQRTESGLDSWRPSQPQSSRSSSVSAAVVHVPDAPMRSSATLPTTPRSRRRGQFALMLLLLVAVGGGGFFAARWAEPSLPTGLPEGRTPAAALPIQPASPVIQEQAGLPASTSRQLELPLAPKPVGETKDREGQSVSPMPSEGTPPVRAPSSLPRRPSKKRTEDVPVNPYR